MSTADTINAISEWVDRGLRGKSGEAIDWHRISKLSEEVGEVVEAMIGATDGNPRKPNSHTFDDVRKELLDVALAALCAHAHLNGNDGDSFMALAHHARYIASCWTRGSDWTEA